MNTIEPPRSLHPTFNATVGDIETPTPRWVTPETSIIEAAQHMKLLDVGMLPVCERGRLVGTLTDRDITVRAVANGYNPILTRVGEVMTRELICCYRSSPVEEAARMMEERRVRRLLVVDDDGRLSGILTLGDLVRRTDRRRLAGEVLEQVSEPNYP